MNFADSRESVKVRKSVHQTNDTKELKNTRRRVSGPWSNEQKYQIGEKYDKSYQNIPNTSIVQVVVLKLRFKITENQEQFVTWNKRFIFHIIFDLLETNYVLFDKNI